MLSGYTAIRRTPPARFGATKANFNVRWAPPEGYLRGFSLRVRYAVVDQHDSSVENLQDIRVIINYNFGMDVKI